MSIFLGIVAVVIVGLLIIGIMNSIEMNASVSKMSPANKKIYQDIASHGPKQAEMICPHCQNKGAVHIKSVNKKAGISGAKATGALLTGGVSLLATGLSRKDELTEAFCSNCSSKWHF